MATKNPIWDFFDKNETKATCKTCFKTLSLGKNQTVANIKNHLEKIHKKEWQKYIKANFIMQSKFYNAKIRKIKNMKSPYKSVKSEDVMMQPTLSPIMKREITAVWADDHPISLRIDKSIMDLIIVDMLPYNIVESNAFRRLNITDPNSPSRYRKKSEKFFRTSLMPATYDKVKKKIFNLVSKTEWISFTVNIWRNPTKTCSLLSFTAHFIKGSTRLKVILEAMVLNEDHTGSVIAKKLIEVFNEYQIKNKIHMITWLMTSKMSAALCGNFTSLECIAHTLKLVIIDSIFKNEKILILIKKCRKIVDHFKKSEQANRYLNQFQETHGLPKHALIQDIETDGIAPRWNSTYLMMERMFEQKNAINLYMAKCGGINVPTVEEWSLMNHLITVLKCFYQAILDISADSACVSLIIPLIAMLNTKLEIKAEDSGEIYRLKQRLCESVNKRFSYVKNCSHLTIATIIDPRFKTKYLTDDEITNCKAKIITFLHQEFSKTLLKNATNTMDEIVASTSSTPQAQEMENLWDMHDNMSTLESFNSEDFPPFDEDLKSYLKEPLLKRNADIFHYWDSSPYIYLKKVAIKYLSAPPTSVPSEQLFSAVGQIYADRKANLLGENTDKLLFLAYNIQLFNFDY